MDLSLQKTDFNWSQIRQVDLLQERVQNLAGEKLSISLENVWPCFVFLKAMGFEFVHFNTSDAHHIDAWRARMETYQQSFLEDPESIDFEECVWSEIDESTYQTLIQCHLKEHNLDKRAAVLFAVPPMEAPLSVEPHALRGFLQEVEFQKDEDILLRLQSILREFQNDSKSIEPETWTRLVGDIIAVALESRQLEKASRFAEEHRESLKSLWLDSERSVRIFSAYEPSKSVDIQQWARIFESLSTERLIQFFQQHLSTPAGPQIVRLMNSRVAQHPEDFAKHCFNAEPSLQKLLLQWLSPFWGPQHYGQLRKALLTELNTNSDFELLHSWIQALLRSYRSQALKDLKTFFTPKSWKEKLFQRKSCASSQHQRPILKAMAELPSSDTLIFLKDIRKSVKGEIADEVERLIQSYQSRKYS